MFLSTQTTAKIEFTDDNKFVYSFVLPDSFLANVLTFKQNVIVSSDAVRGALETALHDAGLTDTQKALIRALGIE